MLRSSVFVLFVLAAASTTRADGVTQLAPTDVSFSPSDVYAVPRGDSPAFGPANAPITIVAFSDYACAFCAAVQDTLDRLDRLYPGQIRWVERALPFEDEMLATEAALAAAAQGQFRPMHERLYALHGRVDRVQVELVARELGLDMLRFRADLDAGVYRKAIAADVADGRALGITATPMFFINGRPVHGNQPLAVFADVVDQELLRVKDVIATHPADLYAALVAHGKPRADLPGDMSNPQIVLSSTNVYRIGFGLPNHAIGKEDALVTIVEWSDFECPFCAKQAPVLAELRAKYGDDLRVVYRHYPVRFHRDSILAAEAGAAAADQGKFWPFHDEVFAHFGALSRPDLERYAKAAGLDVAKFRAALDDRRFHDAVIAEGAAAAALGVDGTPTLFINGRPYVGMRDVNTLDHLISAYIDLEKEMLARGVPRAMLYALAMSIGHGEDRADPASVPEPVHIELRDDARTRAADAACRRRDRARAAELAAPLDRDSKARVANVCAGEGIDL